MPPRGAGRLALVWCSVGVLLAAADTYVIVLALPDMMVGVGIDADELHRAAPLVSMFLLGYVVALPLAGRLSDVMGRAQVALGALVVFCAGSALTASATDLTQTVVGRFGQGAGGGALVPVTLALVADLWPPQRRGVPLGVVGAVQELGAVLGPLFGAAVLSFADWRAIFWINLGLGAALILGVWATVPRASPDAIAPSNGTAAVNAQAPQQPRRRDWIGILLAVATVTAAGLALASPAAVERSVTWGWLLVPTAGHTAWTTPLALGAMALAVALVGWETVAARNPWLPLRRLPAVARSADVLGAALLAVALGCVVLAFATAEPAVTVVGPGGRWLLAGAGIAVVTFAWWQRRTRAPLVPAPTVRARPAWGAIAVSAFVGAALVAVVVEVPVLTRTVVPDADQVDAALVLLRFLVALPVGALLGGWLVRRVSPAVVTAVGMGAAAVGLGVMAGWDIGALASLRDDLVLVGTGLGFGLAVAPVNAALLAATPREVHGIASALLVVARMIGMLVGLSVLTAIGLRRLYATQAGIDSPVVLCPDSPTDCPPYNAAVRDALVEQVQAVFTGAAGCAFVAALGAAVLLRRAPAAAMSPRTDQAS